MVKDNPKTQPKRTAGKKQRSAIADVVAREYTIHLHKRVSRDIPFDFDTGWHVWEQCCDEDNACVGVEMETSGGGTLEHERQITSETLAESDAVEGVNSYRERAGSPRALRSFRIEEREGSYTAHKPAGREQPH